MNIRALAIVVLLGLGIAWWFIHEDDETRVRDAHATLAELVSRTADDGRLSVLEIRTLQQMFAEPTVIAGDGEGLLGTWAPNDLAGVIVSAREVFPTLELAFENLAVTFPDPDEASSSFTATLSAISERPEIEPLSEQRSVSGRMRRVDGEWRFTEFRLLPGTSRE